MINGILFEGSITGRISAEKMHLRNEMGQVFMDKV